MTALPGIFSLHLLHDLLPEAADFCGALYCHVLTALISKYNNLKNTSELYIVRLSNFKSSTRGSITNLISLDGGLSQCRSVK